MHCILGISILSIKTNPPARPAMPFGRVPIRAGIGQASCLTASCTAVPAPQRGRQDALAILKCTH